MDLFEGIKDTQVYTVSQLTKEIRFMMEDIFHNIWIEGEISNYILSSAGHAYFSLKDSNSILGCVMFRGNSSGVKFDMRDGMQVLCYGKVSVYDKRGQYQLYVARVEPKGKGALQMAFEQLKKKLQDEGLFDEENKKAIPEFPLRLGVVTSPTGAAIRDILQISRRRYPNIEIILRPVKVQGDGAAEDIARGIKELNEYNGYLRSNGKEEDQIDVMIVGRGGGSLEDLWAFNEEVVARAVFASEIPVVSAVGHEVDYTISDFVADFRAPTPSAAAELAIPLKEELANRISDCRTRIYNAVKKRLEFFERELKILRESYVLRDPINVYLQLGQQVDDLRKSADTSITHLLEIKSKELAAVSGKFHVLSPISVLDRGYSITFKGNKVVKKRAALKEGDLMETKFSDGSVRSRVEGRP